MKTKREFSREYKSAELWEPGACAGPQYGSANDDTLLDKISELCISTDNSLLWYSNGSLLKINVYDTLHRLNHSLDNIEEENPKYETVVKVEIMPPTDLPQELSDLLTGMGFNEKMIGPRGI